MLAVFAEKTGQTAPCKTHAATFFIVVVARNFNKTYQLQFHIQKRSCNYFFAPLLITPVCRNKKLFCCKNFSTTPLTANPQTKKVLQLLSITLLLHHRSNARVTKKLFSGVTMHVSTAARERATTATTTVPRCTAKRLPACVYVKKHADKTLRMYARCAFKHDIAFRKHKQLQKHLQQQALRQFAFA